MNIVKLISISCVQIVFAGSIATGQIDLWEKDNPIQPIPEPPLGVGVGEKYKTLLDFPEPPTPERVRLGRWLFFDKRLSADDTIACANCHQPDKAFSETTPNSTGIDGQTGDRKAPSFVNLAWTKKPHFFWDGRASSLEDQAGGPMINPIEMGNPDHNTVVEKIRSIQGYAKYFEESFDTPEITIERITKAIADYERTRMSGNSPWDQWRTGKDQDAVSAEVKKGHQIFFGDGFCNNCHLGHNLTDNDFHNLGIGWDEESETFSDIGRYAVTEKDEHKGAFKTPSLRDVSKRAPYMHDGSMKSLREVVEFYSKGGTPNPYLDRDIDRRFAEHLDFTEEEINALVAFMEALDGEGYQDEGPKSFPE